MSRRKKKKEEERKIRRRQEDGKSSKHTLKRMPNAFELRKVRDMGKWMMIEREEKAKEDCKSKIWRERNKKMTNPRNQQQTRKIKINRQTSCQHVNSLTVPDSGGQQRLHTLSVSPKGRQVQRRPAELVPRADT